MKKKKKLFTSAVLVQVIMCRKINVSIPGIVLAGTSNQSASAQYVTQLDFTMRQSNASLKFNYCATLCCSFLLMSNKLQCKHMKSAMIHFVESGISSFHFQILFHKARILKGKVKISTITFLEFLHFCSEIIMSYEITEAWEKHHA